MYEMRGLNFPRKKLPYGLKHAGLPLPETCSKFKICFCPIKEILQGLAHLKEIFQGLLSNFLLSLPTTVVAHPEFLFNIDLLQRSDCFSDTNRTPGGRTPIWKGRGHSSYLLGVKKAILVPVFSRKRSTAGALAVLFRELRRRIMTGDIWQSTNF